MSCNCRVCTDHARWLAALNPQTDEAKSALDEMLSRIEAAETDVSVSKAKLEGKWPGWEIEKCKHGVVKDPTGNYVCVKCLWDNAKPKDQG